MCETEFSSADTNCCVIYENKEKMESDTAATDSNVDKILLDTFLTCILKQSIDMSNMIEHDAQKESEHTES